MRKLKIYEGGTTEVNRLVVSNLMDFLSEYGNTSSHRASPFHILSELEKEVIHQNEPEKSILIEYKEDGYQEFYLKGIGLDDDRRLAIYEWIGGIS